MPPIDYHLGISWQALGEKANAIAAFNKEALLAKTGLNKEQKQDADKRLKTLQG